MRVDSLWFALRNLNNWLCQHKSAFLYEQSFLKRPHSPQFLLHGNFSSLKSVPIYSLRTSGDGSLSAMTGDVFLGDIHSPKPTVSLPYLKLTWSLKIGRPKRKLIFQPSICSGAMFVVGSVPLEYQTAAKAHVTMVQQYLYSSAQTKRSHRNGSCTSW